MRLLAIDTALEACAAAILDTKTGELLASESQLMARGHAEALMPLLARVMDHAGVEFRELDRIAVTVGPGSFTGLRVGISAARGIALAAAKPAVGLSTLSAFAAPHIAAASAEAVLAAIDARNDSAYVQIFAAGGRTLLAPALLSLDEAAKAAVGLAPLLVGSAADKLAARWPPNQPPPLAVAAESAPDIGWIARLGAAADEPRGPPRPLYLRRPDARPQAASLPRH